jgi:hypothetical protein
MSEIISFPPNVHPNKPRPRDRADEVAGALLAMILRHVVDHWDEETGDFDIGALQKKIAAILRIEFEYAGRLQ